MKKYTKSRFIKQIEKPDSIDYDKLTKYKNVANIKNNYLKTSQQKARDMSMYKQTEMYENIHLENTREKRIESK